MVLLYISTPEPPEGLVIFRDDVLVGDCTGATVQAVPDPCAWARGAADGTVLIAVLTTNASIWQLGHRRSRANADTYTRALANA